MIEKSILSENNSANQSNISLHNDNTIDKSERSISTKDNSSHDDSIHQAMAEGSDHEEGIQKHMIYHGNCSDIKASFVQLFAHA